MAFCMDCQKSTYFYPRSPCGERPDEIAARLCDYCISIHALLAESDIFNASCTEPIQAFLSTLSLRRATTAKSKKNKEVKFLSTLSLRRATVAKLYLLSIVDYFYPRSPCGERLTGAGVGLYLVTISIHALLAESDPRGRFLIFYLVLFLSTLSLRRATAFRIGSRSQKPFLSTLSLRRATCCARL